VLITEEVTEYVVATSEGMAIRFAGNEVRAMGLVAAGVNAIKLPKGAFALGFVDLKNADDLLFIASDGFGWRIKKEDFPVQGRYGQGVVIGKLKPGSKVTGLVAGKKNLNITIFLKKSAAKAIRLDSVVLGKRGAVAKSVLEVKIGDSVERMMTPVDTLEKWSEKKPMKKQEPLAEEKAAKKKYEQGKIL
jgi:DNA gyrase/topoisomerase IV subunit A